MNYAEHLIKSFEKIWAELEYLLQDGAMLSNKEKEKLLEMLYDIEKLVGQFNSY